MRARQEYRQAFPMFQQDHHSGMAHLDVGRGRMKVWQIGAYTIEKTDDVDAYFKIPFQVPNSYLLVLMTGWGSSLEFPSSLTWGGQTLSQLLKNRATTYGANSYGLAAPDLGRNLIQLASGVQSWDAVSMTVLLFSGVHQTTSTATGSNNGTSSFSITTAGSVAGGMIAGVVGGQNSEWTPSSGHEITIPRPSNYRVLSGSYHADASMYNRLANVGIARTHGASASITYSGANSGEGVQIALLPA